ncbi:hypothetical protein Amsp01_026420 [Amycolatopsis sp. NBRC 101858]|uniref:hypothetical protein n=1 Tax=Amycolatopsis sp. NBRC 101858 TaxID=3032200 RepID=UPI0024A5086F|nr:hypothetical protein [Amycolatopsis sp. NBRC 101858]GLY36618.1 hypothetical protein Amsp01_026420 [Amycolatopsis sp. NBRC 101858]
MRFSGASFAAACLLTCVTACWGGSTTAAPATTPALPSSTSASKPKPTAPTFTPAASPEKLTAACPFLSDTEIMQALDNTLTGGMKETEPVRTGYVCEYGVGHLAELIVGTDTRSRAGFISAAKAGCTEPAAIPGIGAAAMRCRPADQRFATFISAAKNSHGQLRTAELYLVPEGGEAACAKLGKLLADRL